MKRGCWAKNYFWDKEGDQTLYDQSSKTKSHHPLVSGLGERNARIYPPPLNGLPQRCSEREAVINLLLALFL